MIKLITTLSLLLSLCVQASSIKNAFKEFYDDSQISSRHCGRNIHYFLNYLKDKRINYKSGYVVSIHEDVGALNHFDARWGSKEEYAQGGSYYRSNWYFHVFAVIDGVAYDFSQRGAKTTSVKTYLEDAYLPKGTTQSIIFLGRLDKKKAYQKYKNMKVKIYDLDEYAKDYGTAIYQGAFIELFNLIDKRPSKSYGKKYSQETLDYDSYRKTRHGYTIKNPMMKKEGKFYPLLADSYTICRAFGFLGSVNSQLSYEVSDKVKMLKLYSSMPKSGSRFVSSKDIKLSSSFYETDGDIPSQPLLHYATSVTCSDLNSIGI